MNMIIYHFAGFVEKVQSYLDQVFLSMSLSVVLVIYM